MRHLCVSAMLLGLILFYSCEKKRSVQSSSPSFEDQTITQPIVPPFEGIAAHTSTQTIDPSKRQVLSFEGGIQLEVPQNTFVDKEGNTIRESVTLSVSTYNSKAEIIASGIPMSYATSNGSSSFESAGMFHVGASSAGKEVFIDEKKEIQLQQLSSVFGEYDFYHFEEQESPQGRQGDWKKMTQKKNTISCDASQAYSLQFAIAEKPALAPLQAIQWKLMTENGGATIKDNPWVLDEKWSAVEISQPKYGYGKVIMKSPSDWFLEELYVSKNKERFLTSYKDEAKLWTNKGELLVTVKDLTNTFSTFVLLNDEIILFALEDKTLLYSIDGELLHELPASILLDAKLTSSNDYLYYVTRSSYFSSDEVLYIANAKGETLKKISYEYKEDSKQDFARFHYQLIPNDHLVIVSYKGIEVLDSDGERIYHRAKVASSFKYIKENLLLIEEKDGSLTVLNYENGKSIHSKKEAFQLGAKTMKTEGNRTTSTNNSSYRVIPHYPLVAIKETFSKHSILWNYETNEITTLDFEVNDQLKFNNIYSVMQYIPRKPSFLIGGFNPEDYHFHLYDIEQKRKVFQGKVYDATKPISFEDLTPSCISFSSDSTKFTFSSPQNQLYYDLAKGLLKDFRASDTTVFACGFHEDDRLYSMSSYGVCKYWDQKGDYMSSKVFPIKGLGKGYEYDDHILLHNHFYNQIHECDKSGTLLLSSMDGLSSFSTKHPQNAFRLTAEKELYFHELFSTAPNTYQLTLQNEEHTFVTYVCMSEQDLEKLNQYYALMAKSAAKERERKVEQQKVVRLFSLKKMGLYNWDLLIKEEDHIKFKADFDFDVAVDKSLLTVFLITEVNGTSVIKYAPNNWGSFALKPGVKNQLLAVLPDNKVAVFDDFEGIDFQKIKEAGHFTFKMKVKDESITSLEDLENLLL